MWKHEPSLTPDSTPCVCRQGSWGQLLRAPQHGAGRWGGTGTLVAGGRGGLEFRLRNPVPGEVRRGLTAGSRVRGL